MKTPRKFLWFAATLVLVSALNRQTCAAKKPNVLFLFSDDQRADTIAALGNTVIKTPNLDKIVRSGFVFDNAYCLGSTSGAVCNPSRHMMLSGMSLFRYKSKPSDPSFGKSMREAGYETYHHSKTGNTAKVYHKHFEHSHYLNDGAERTSGHHGRTAASDAIKFLKERDSSRPFFMYVSFAGPHDPRVAADQWMNLYDRKDILLPKNYKPFHPFDNGEMLVRDEQLAPWPRTEEVVRKHLHDYYACISSIDHNIGRVIQTLKEQGEFDNTIIVFSADHGLAVGSHGLFGKQSLYEHSMKSPMVFSGPGISKGRSDGFMYLHDIYPTVCQLVGAPIPDGLDGRSQTPVIQGKKKSVRDTVFLAYKNVMRAARQGDWKLIRYPQVNVTQLFNLRNDPNELSSLADDPTQSGKVAELTAALQQQQKLAEDPHPLTVENPKPAVVTLEFFENLPKKAQRKKKKKRVGK